MGKTTLAWMEWLTQDEQQLVADLDKRLAELRHEVIVARAERLQFMRRAQTRRYVVKSRD